MESKTIVYSFWDGMSTHVSVIKLVSEDTNLVQIADQLLQQQYPLPKGKLSAPVTVIISNESTEAHTWSELINALSLRIVLPEVGWDNLFTGRAMMPDGVTSLEYTIRYGLLKVIALTINPALINREE